MMRVVLGNREVLITDVVLGIVDMFRGGDHESGGIILGQVSLGEERILVSRLSLPGPNDVSGRASFLRRRDGVRRIIEYEFHNSGGTNTYLGEWHTHPAKQAEPSAVDKDMISDQNRLNRSGVNFTLIMIASLSELLVGIFQEGHLTTETRPFPSRVSE